MILHYTLKHTSTVEFLGEVVAI